MRPTFFIAIFALTSIAAPINKDQSSDLEAALAKRGGYHRKASGRSVEPYIGDQAGNKREAARGNQGGYHRKASGRRAEDSDTKADVKRGYSRGQQKRDDDNVADDELDARAIRNFQRSEEDEVEARAIRNFQRSEEDDIEARQLRPNGRQGRRPGSKRSDDEDDVEARAIRNFQRSEEDDVEARAIRNFQRSEEDDIEVDTEELEEVVARGVKNANNYKPTSGGFWRHGQRSADPESANRPGNSKRDAVPEPAIRCRLHCGK